MRTIVFVLSFFGLIGLAFWAYRENYRTQAELNAVRALRTEIGILRESLGVLRAEWAYLNRPDRLRELADINFDRLGLMPLDPTQFGSVEQVSYPQFPTFDLTEPVDTIGAEAAADTGADAGAHTGAGPAAEGTAP